MKEELSAAGIRVGLVDAEDARTFGMQYAPLYEVIDRSTGLERRIQLEKRLGPQRTAIQSVLHKLGGAGVPNLDEAVRVARVVGDQAVSKIKDVHSQPPAAHEAGKVSESELKRFGTEPLRVGDGHLLAARMVHLLGTFGFSLNAITLDCTIGIGVWHLSAWSQLVIGLMRM